MAEQNTNTGQEQAYITANHKKENLKVSQMSPDEKLHYLRVKQKYHHLTFDETNELNKLQNNEIEVNPNRDLKKTRPKEGEEINDIFKEEDILSYMYQHWLLDGMNWLFKKTYSGVEYGTDWLATKTWNAGKTFIAGYKDGKAIVQNNPNGRDDAMSRFATDVDRRYVKASGDQITQIDRDAQARMEQINRFVNGTPKDDEKNSLLYRIVSQMEPSRKKEFTDAMQKSTKAFASNIKTIQYMAATLTRTQLIQNQMANGDVHDAPNQALFESQMKRNAILITQLIENNPSKRTWNKLFKNIEKARKTVNESMTDGKYKSNKNNSPKKNKALSRVNDMLGLDKEGNLQPNVQIEDHSEESLVEWAIRNNTIDLERRQNLQELNNRAIANQADMNNYIQSRANLYQRAASMHNAPEHIKQAVQQHQANDNQQQMPQISRGERS